MYAALCRGGAGVQRRRGRAVQVDPIKPTLKAPGIKQLKLYYDELLSKFAFNSNLRRYTVVVVSHDQHFLKVTDATLMEVTGDAAPGCKEFEGDIKVGGAG
jgi:hypothetical protein